MGSEARKTFRTISLVDKRVRLWLTRACVCVCMTSLFAVAGSAQEISSTIRVEDLTNRTEDTTAHIPESADALGLALNKLNLDRSAVGIRPDPTWARFPHPQHIPYVLPSFEGLYAKPLSLYKTSRTMANAVQRFLSPDAMQNKPHALHKLVYYLGIDKRSEGFRDYSVNLPSVAAQDPLLQAMRALYALDDKPLVTQSFGKTIGLDEADWIKRVDDLPPGLEGILATLVSGLTDAMRWQRTAFRNVPANALQQTWELRDLQMAQADGLAYFPQLDDVARFLDEASLNYACMKTVQASQNARTSLLEWFAKLSKSDRQRLYNLSIHWQTPFGEIVVRGTRNNTDQSEQNQPSLLLIDLGGDDIYKGRVGASMSIKAPMSVCIDLSGNDIYRNDDPNMASQGAGIFGAGVLIDVVGDDQYFARNLSQGVGLFGLGLLLDEQGNDRYELETSGQGCGYFGMGFCLDIEGADQYLIQSSGQGFGGVGGGIGVLANFSGKDHYVAKVFKDMAPDEASTNRRVNVSNAQGVGRGRRGDGSDGHSWAGGLGALFDLQGDDTYESGNWSLGAGYWFGTGIAFDGSGDDTYRSVYFTQGAAAHYANGVFVDESGDDKHILFETAGAAFAFGWDFANAVFVNKSGNDQYEASRLSFGCADIRSNALFFDLDGDDRYQLGKDQRGLGAADYHDNYKNPDPIAPYNSEATSLGLFLDIGGKDHYKIWDGDSDKTQVSVTWLNGGSWMSPAPATPEFGYRNYGLGLDLPRGKVPELQIFEDQAR